MAKKLFCSVFLLFFILSSFLAIGEPLSSGPDTESGSFLFADRHDPSSDGSPSGVPGRLLRAKSFVKVPVGFNVAKQRVSHAGWMNEPWPSPSISKRSVYQRISVYRL